MHTRASNSELVEALPEPERTLNQRLRRRNRRVPYDQRNNPPQHLRIVLPPILNINYFRHFLDILQNYNPMNDEPMWAVDRVVAPTPGFVITIPETANEFAIKDIENEVVHLMMFSLSLTREAKTWLDELNEGTIEMCEITQEVLNVAAGGIFLYKTPNQAYQLLEDKVLHKLDWAKNKKTKSSLKKTIAFADEADLGASINLMPYSLYAKLSLETLKPTTMSVRLADISFQYPVGIAENMLVEVGKFTFPADFVILEMEEDNKVPIILG
ncbi:reverse transcriptase domain-containing protein [Tanacetum coccineum]